MLKFTTQLITFALLFASSVSLIAQEDLSPAKLYNNALAKMKEKAYEEAFPMFEEALAKADTTKENDLKVIRLANRNGASCAYRLGSATRKGGDHAKALELFEKGIAMNPDYFGNYLGKAQAIEGIGEDKIAALNAYVMAGDMAAKSEKTMKQMPKMYSKAQRFSSSAYVKAKDYEQSIALADAYLAARGEEVNDAYIANYYKAASLNKMDKNEDALPVIQASVAALPEGEDADKYHLLHGIVNQILGNNDAAIEAYSMVKGEKNEKYKAAAQSRIDALKQ